MATLAVTAGSHLNYQPGRCRLVSMDVRRQIIEFGDEGAIIKITVRGLWNMPAPKGITDPDPEPHMEEEKREDVVEEGIR